jgi:c(7)-type cytochrome triheme protein
MKRLSVFLLFAGIFLLTSIALGRVGGGDIVFNPKKANPVTFSHDFHVKDLGLACQKCHPNPYITRDKDKPLTMAAMNQGKSCGACHNGKGGFSVKAKDKCGMCHR